LATLVRPLLDRLKSAFVCPTNRPLVLRMSDANRPRNVG